MEILISAPRPILSRTLEVTSHQPTTVSVFSPLLVVFQSSHHSFNPIFSIFSNFFIYYCKKHSLEVQIAKKYLVEARCQVTLSQGIKLACL